MKSSLCTQLAGDEFKTLGKIYELLTNEDVELRFLLRFSGDSFFAGNECFSDLL